MEMATISAAKFITEFGAEGRPKETPNTWPTQKQSASAAVASGKASPRTEDAYERGVAAGKAAILADIETRLEANRVYYAQQLELERFTWANREAEKLADLVAAGIREIETNIANTTARILKPFLAQHAHRMAVAELLEALEILIGKNQGMTLEISGPEDLLQLIREKLRDRNVAALFSPGDGVDVRVVAGHSVLETSLGAWMDKLRSE
jgi:hypothetical protein